MCLHGEYSIINYWCATVYLFRPKIKIVNIINIPKYEIKFHSIYVINVLFFSAMEEKEIYKMKTMEKQRQQIAHRKGNKSSIRFTPKRI